MSEAVIITERALAPAIRWAMLAAAFGMAVRTQAETPVLRDGRVLLPVVVAAEATPEEQAAAQELARVLGVMAGTDWPVALDRPDVVGLHVGHIAGNESDPAPALASDFLALGPGEWGPDAFRIRTKAGSVFIEAATPEATGYAVAWFLQKTAGVRWYAPGEWGEVVPRRQDWSVPELNRTVQPAYLSREIYPTESADEKVWARRNGLRGRLDYTHAMCSVFSLETLASHPDWLPLVRGQKQRPAGKADHNWQPNLALSGVAAHAAQQAMAAFAAEPERRSFSLGMNDSLRFDQSVATQAAVTPLRYFRGMPDYSPLVFGFMNRAAASVARSRDDRYLGCLAYFWCENVPPFPVHPQVVPYVTTDRSQYYDPAYRAADLELMTRWQGSGVRAYGLWEYAYGQGFLIPRITPTALAEGLREGWHRGARGYLAEMSPHAGFDAFKSWMISRLLWEPDLSCQELADDFFPGYYGRAAGPMRDFFDRCEARWTTQSGPAYWLKFYQQEDQALLFPPAVCRELRGRLTEALALADTPAIVARVEQTSRAFAVTEAYVEFDAVRRGLSAVGDVSEAVLTEGAARLLHSEQKLGRAWELACAGSSPAMARTRLEPFLANDPVPRLLWQVGQGDAGFPGRILPQSAEDVPALQRWRHLASVVASGLLSTAPNLTVNGSFTDHAPEGLEPRFLYGRSADVPAGWDWRAVPTESGSVALLAGADATGNRTLRIEGAWNTQFFQWARAVPGVIYVAKALLRGASAPGGEASLYLSFLSASGEAMGPTLVQSLPKGETAGWRTVVLADRAPEQAAWVGLGFGATRQAATDWLEVKSVGLRSVTAGGGVP